MLEFLYRADPPERPAPTITLPDRRLRPWKERAVDSRGKPLVTLKGKPVTPENSWGFTRVEDKAERHHTFDTTLRDEARALAEKAYGDTWAIRLAKVPKTGVPAAQIAVEAKPTALSKKARTKLAVAQAKAAKAEAERVVLERLLAEEAIEAMSQEEALVALVQAEQAEEPDEDRIELLERKALGVTGRQVNAYMAALAAGGEEDPGANAAVGTYVKDEGFAQVLVLEARLDGAKLTKSPNVRSLAAKLGALKKRLEKGKA